MRRWRPATGWLGVALASVAGGVALALASAPEPVPREERAAAPAGAEGESRAALSVTVPATKVPGAAPVDAAPSPPVSAVPAAPRAWEPGSDPTPDLSNYVNPGEAPTMAEVIDRLHAAGVHGGLGAFSRPGTRPPLVGLAVPETFALPPGYVRHYQTTDDGQRIEPVLMFAPGAALVDAAGNPVAIPPDRLVPPELAPPGLPLRRIEIPAPLEAGRSGR